MHVARLPWPHGWGSLEGRNMTAIELVHLVVTLAMTGVIWSVQCVQYPLFARVGLTEFSEYHQLHVERIGYVVAPLMAVEVSTAVALVVRRGADAVFVVSLVMLLVAWGSTFAIQVPLHRKLAVEWSETSVHRLILSNWLRTAAWTARAALLCSAIPLEN
jgi:hypothetical protein